VPAETGGEDRLAGSLTFRHAAYLAVAAAGVAVMLLGERSPVRVVAGALLALVGVAGAVCRPYGEPLDRLVPAAVGYLRRRRAERRDTTHDAGPTVPTTPDPPTAVPEPDEPPTPLPVPMRQRLPLRPLAAVVAVAAVLAVAVARWPHAAPPEPSLRVVVVTVPIPAPDPWEEAIDDAMDSWLDDVLGT
jgi:hypothetical protein